MVARYLSRYHYTVSLSFLGTFWNALWSRSIGILAGKQCWVSKSTGDAGLTQTPFPLEQSCCDCCRVLLAQHNCKLSTAEISPGCDPCSGCSLSISETMIRACASFRGFKVPRDVSKQTCKLKHCLVKQIGLNFIEAVISFQIFARYLNI